MVCSLMSVKTNAGTLGDLTYEIANGEVTITKCSPSAKGELGVPDEIEGLPAISIGERALRRLHWSDLDRHPRSISQPKRGKSS